MNVPSALQVAVAPMSLFLLRWRIFTKVTLLQQRLLVMGNTEPELAIFCSQQGLRWRDWDTNSATRPLIYSSSCMQRVLGPSLAESSKRPERFHPTTDGHRCSVPQPNISLNPQSPSEDREEGLEETDRSRTAPPWEQVHRLIWLRLMGTHRDQGPIGVSSRSSAYILWLNSLVVFFAYPNSESKDCPWHICQLVGHFSSYWTAFSFLDVMVCIWSCYNCVLLTPQEPSCFLRGCGDMDLGEREGRVRDREGKTVVGL